MFKVNLSSRWYFNFLWLSLILNIWISKRIWQSTPGLNQWEAGRHPQAANSTYKSWTTSGIPYCDTCLKAWLSFLFSRLCCFQSPILRKFWKQKFGPGHCIQVNFSNSFRIALVNLAECPQMWISIVKTWLVSSLTPTSSKACLIWSRDCRSRVVSIPSWVCILNWLISRQAVLSGLHSV